jgi:putative flippase GtrA
MKIILFIFTGGVGFLTEIAIIQISVFVFGASHISARIVSFPVAVFVTWAINRKLTFTSRNKSIQELGKYAFVQVIGGGINLCIYYLIVTNQKFETINPIIVLAFASLCSMIFTYLGSQKMVFTTKTKEANL